MKQLITTLVLCFAFGTAFAQFPKYVKKVDVKLNGSTTLKGDLSEGRYIDLRFGMRGSVGCFTESEKTRFSGHHRLYAFEVPAGTKVLVELTSRSDMSLYGYMISSTRFDVPPYLENVSKAGCSASTNGQGELDRIMMKAGSETTHVIIAVTGVEEASAGEFTVKVTTRQ